MKTLDKNKLDRLAQTNTPAHEDHQLIHNTVCVQHLKQVVLKVYNIVAKFFFTSCLASSFAFIRHKRAFYSLMCLAQLLLKQVTISNWIRFAAV
jgi:hypothetical protein